MNNLQILIVSLSRLPMGLIEIVCLISKWLVGFCEYEFMKKFDKQCMAI